MKKLRMLISLLILTLMLSLPAYAGQDVIDPELDHVLQGVDPGEEVPVIVTLSEKVDLSQVKEKDKASRRSMVIEALMSKSQLAQRPAMSFLEGKGVKPIPFWIINGMALKASRDVIQELALQPGIENIRLDAAVEAPVVTYATAAPPEWNISAIKAPDLWSLGFTGTGVVVASMDTGVDSNHPDLKEKWRGGTNSWYDPNSEHSTPYDAHGHGTGTMGIIVGGDKGGTSIGVAPDAKWIAVKIFDDSGYSTLSKIHLGFQWILDPDSNPATDDAPDIVNNSWGLTNPGGCNLEFLSDIQALKASYIEPIFAAGNSGPGSSTSVSPANYAESFPVGAVDSTLTVASFSSRGPSDCDGSPYPEVSAPGVSVKTSDITFGGAFPNSYSTMSGTSFAAPHVAGAMALLLNAVPGTTISALESALNQTAVDNGASGTDNDYGYGLIDVLAAYNLLNASVNNDADGDGFSSYDDCNDNDPTIYPGASEIKSDGVDQDCNGYDLTINVIKASYSSKTDTLTVEATSSLEQAAMLELVSYGPMKWNSTKGKWTITVRKAGGNPGTITVSGTEGSDSDSVR